MKYLISTLLVLLTCVPGFADQVNPPNTKTKNPPGQNRPTSTTTATEDELVNAPVEKVNDPFEGLNHTNFRVNDTVTIHVIKPIANGYEHIVPATVRTGLLNFFDNLDFPVRFGNNVLQGRFVRSGQEVEKFVVNSTAGIAGLVRVSDRISSLANVPPEDFGLTLARWGFSSGPYLVVPLVGPSSVRDLTGVAGDFALNPLNWYLIFSSHRLVSNVVGYSIAGTKFVVRAPAGIHAYEQMKEAAVDPYVAVRNAYLSHRATQVGK